MTDQPELPETIYLLREDAEKFARKYGHPNLELPCDGDDAVQYNLTPARLHAEELAEALLECGAMILGLGRAMGDENLIAAGKRARAALAKLGKAEGK